MVRILHTLALAVQWAVTLFLALLLGCNLYLLGLKHLGGVEDPSLFGYTAAVIASGSMEPALQVDDLIFSHAQPSYQPGDIITFRTQTSLTTHRIAAVTGEGYITKGDANNAADPDPVPPEAVLGRVVWRIPGVGRGIALLRSPLGMLLMLLAAVALIELPLHRSRQSPKGEDS